MAVLRLPRGPRRPAAMLSALLGAAVALAMAMPASALAAAPGPERRAGPARARVRAVPPSGLTATQGQGPADATATTLAETGARPGGVVTFTATVTGEARAAHLPVRAGTVSLYRNGASRPLGVAASGTGSGTGVYRLSVRLDAVGPVSVVAVYAPPGGSTRYRGSTSPAVAVTGPACSTCSGVETTADIVPAGVLSISTPYTASDPLDLGTLALDPSGTFFSASVPLDPGSSDVTTAGSGPAGQRLDLLRPACRGSAGRPGRHRLTRPGRPGRARDHYRCGTGGGHDGINGINGINGTITINAPTSTQAGTFGGAIVLTVSNGTPSG
jgi:hypothetical protein